MSRTLPAFLLLLLVNPLQADDLARKINEVIQRQEYRSAHWGILAVEAKSGRVLFEHNADRLFAPASVTKLFSCAAALVEFGPDYRFQTPVYRRGPLARGTLAGDLILVASGDLSMGGRALKDGRLAFTDNDHTYANGSSKAELTEPDPLAGLKALARQVRQAGVRKVTGEVLIDDRLFESARGSGSGPDRLTPILINDNVVDVTITPGAKYGDPASVKLRPETSVIQMDAQVDTVEFGQPSRTTIQTVGPGKFTVRGQVPARTRPVVRIFSVDDPAHFARALFIEQLRNEGVDVDASPLQSPRATLPDQEDYAKLPRVGLLVSHPFSEAIKVILKVSHNLHASTLPLLLAARHDQRTLGQGMRLEQRRLAALGVDTASVCFGGAAGGEQADEVSPRITVQLLQAMRGRPEYTAYRAALPSLGVDGTLSDVVDTKSPARGKVHAKTGTLVYTDRLNDRSFLRSKALAGYLTTARGTEVSFAIFVNNVPLPRGGTTTREGKVLGLLSEIIQQQGP
jgi:D-alanyl-D-alanine carboxypeptidase/D-alanyl-D-alanine-endopeptidase (penicillin-binding protein 4)